jgi:hypothetical protein
LLRRRCPVQELRLAEAFADFAGERTRHDPSISVD